MTTSARTTIPEPGAGAVDATVSTTTGRWWGRGQTPREQAAEAGRWRRVRQAGPRGVAGTRAAARPSCPALTRAMTSSVDIKRSDPGTGEDADAAPAGLLRAFLAGRDVSCPNCEYNLRDLAGDRCPECGM